MQIGSSDWKIVLWTIEFFCVFLYSYNRQGGRTSSSVSLCSRRPTENSLDRMRKAFEKGQKKK